MGILVISAVACLAAAWFIVISGVAGRWLIALLIVLVGAALPLWPMVSTRYTFTTTELDIRSGPFRWRVPLREIRDVTPTRNALSSPALSLDRLRIDYGRRRSIMVSPRDREGFLRELEARRSGAT